MTRTATLLLALLAAPADPALAAPGLTAPWGEDLPSERSELLPVADQLIAEHDCLACHDPDSVARKRLDPFAAPDLAGVAGRVDARWLVDFLEDPRAVRPGTTHPHQLEGRPQPQRRRLAEGLAAFLSVNESTRAQMEPVEETSDFGTVERGRQLFHSVGCVACHGPLEDAYDLEITLVELEAELLAAEEAGEPLEEDGEEYEEEPLLVRPGVLAPDPHALPADLTRKYRIGTLASFLEDPTLVRPSGHCPSMGLESDEARAVAAYLLRAQSQRVDGSQERRPGLILQVYEADDLQRGGLSRLDGIQPVATHVVGEIGVEKRTRDNQFGMRYAGFLEVPADGRYRFHLSSDDGSRLFVGGRVVVDNGGVHGTKTVSGEAELLAGSVPIEVTFFEASGGEVLRLEWEGPGVERGPLPPERLSHWPLVYRVLGADGEPRNPSTAAAPSAEAVGRGRAAFGDLGCATCHGGVLAGTAPATSTAPALSELSGKSAGQLPPRCLRPNGRYAFDEETAGALTAVFLRPGKIAASAAEPEALVQHRLAGRRCYSCHRRDDVGGVHPKLQPFYLGDEDAELGDQGRFPPTLTAVGRKFRPEVLRAALRGEERVRPYLTTRMPRMGERGVDGLAELLELVDGEPDRAEPDVAGAEPACDMELTADGRRLAGVRGLGCVQCHRFLGTESLGVQAIDMGQMHRRLRYEWFRDLLRNPANVDLDARMANLWVDGESPVQGIAGGDIETQIESIWCWLGGEENMAPPPGLETGPWAFEVDATDEPRTVAVFMEGVSPRVLCVGSPTGLHFAFDEQNARLVKAWRGRFLNAEKTWKGRAGGLENPASSDVVEMPPGLPVIPISSMNSTWPEAAGRDMGARIIGRTAHPDGSMTFRYAVGDLSVTEHVRPVELTVNEGATTEPGTRLGVERSFTVRAPAGSPVIARAMVASRFESIGSGRWSINGGAWPVLELDQQSARLARVCDAPEGAGFPAELRIPVHMLPDEPGSDTLVGTFSWRYAW